MSRLGSGEGRVRLAHLLFERDGGFFRGQGD